MLMVAGVMADVSGRVAAWRHSWCTQLDTHFATSRCLKCPSRNKCLDIRAVQLVRQTSDFESTSSKTGTQFGYVFVPGVGQAGFDPCSTNLRLPILVDMTRDSEGLSDEIDVFRRSVTAQNRFK